MMKCHPTPESALMVVGWQICHLLAVSISKGIVQGIPWRTISKSAKFGVKNFQVREIRGEEFPSPRNSGRRIFKSAKFGMKNFQIREIRGEEFPSP
jgi:hypothetical protein